jgi:hypothetical protein
MPCRPGRFRCSTVLEPGRASSGEASAKPPSVAGPLRAMVPALAAREHSAHGRAKEAAGVQFKPPERLRRIKHRHRDLGFTSAVLVHDGSSPQEWCVRVESPAEVDVFREHLAEGRPMSFTFITREGDLYQGEAAVARISPPSEEAVIVTVSGVGPLVAS